MDKNRTDLLAAGRKKLQQYRQKKGGKGSKSSNKSSKSEHVGEAQVSSSTVNSSADGDISASVDTEMSGTKMSIIPESGVAVLPAIVSTRKAEGSTDKMEDKWVGENIEEQISETDTVVLRQSEVTGVTELLPPESLKEEDYVTSIEDGVDSSISVLARDDESQSIEQSTSMVEPREVQVDDDVTQEDSVRVDSYPPDQEHATQEADSVGSSQFDETIEDHCGVLNADKKTNDGFAMVQIGRDGPKESIKNILGASIEGDNVEETSIPEVTVVDEAKMDLEEFCKETDVSDSAASDFGEGYHEKVSEEVWDAAIDETEKVSVAGVIAHNTTNDFIAADDTQMAEKIVTVNRGEGMEELILKIEGSKSHETHALQRTVSLTHKGDEEPAIHMTEKTNEGEGTHGVGVVLVAAVEKNEATDTSLDHEVDAEAQGTKNIIFLEETEEAANRRKETQPASDISDLVQAMHGAEKTYDANDRDKLENAGEILSYVESTQIMTGSGTGTLADIEHDGVVDEVCGEQLPLEAVGPFEADREVLSGKTSLDASTSSVNLYQLAAVFSHLDVKQVDYIVKSIPALSMLQSRDIVEKSTSENDLSHVFESLKQQVYTTNVFKDFLQLQLQEHIDIQIESDRRDYQYQNEVSNMRSMLEESQKEKASIVKELERCRSDFLDIAAGKEDLETKFSNASVENVKLTIMVSELQTELEMSQEELKTLFANLNECQSLLEVCKQENSNLNTDLVLVTDAKRKFEEEKEYYALQNVKISVQLLEHQNQWIKEQSKNEKLEFDLKEAMLRLEELTHENMFLSNTLEIHKEKMEDVKVDFLQLSQPLEGRSQQELMGIPITVLDYPNDDESLRTPVKSDGQTVSDVVEFVDLDLTEAQLIQQLGSQPIEDSVGFFSLKAFLEEAEKTRQKLKKAIEQMQSHLVALSNSAGKKSSLGGSKWIQAFESKVHQNEDNPEELIVVGGEQSPSDPYTLAKEQTHILGAMLKVLELNAEKLNEAFLKEQDGRKLDSLGLSELEVLYEASKRHSGTLEMKNSELEAKLSLYQSRLDDLISESCQVQQDLDEKTSILLSQAENLQIEMVDRISTLENNWNCNLAVMSEAAANLDASTGRVLTPDSSTKLVDSLHYDGHIITSVNAACKVIDYLHVKLEAACSNNEAIWYSYGSLNEKYYDLHFRNELVVGLLGMVYLDLKKFVSDLFQDLNESEMGVIDDILLNHKHPCNYVILVQNLSELLEERLQLKSANEVLQLEVTNKVHEIEQLRRSCIDSEDLNKFVEYAKTVVELDDIEVDSWRSAAVCLESVIAVLVRKCREVTEQVDSSTEELGFKVTELSEKHEDVRKLNLLNLQNLDEINTLKENIRKLEESLETAGNELQIKKADLEQSEQRVSSVREKLSIAVGKGKGLVVQRDSLKQSLSEMSSEIERLSQELQLKDTKLREAETKLRSYSEPGGRVEALESELSYIRNSATALRESFLLKDSILLKMEEILEDLELPEHFHSRDIIEKIEWLARSVAGNSLPNVWGQKSTGGEDSYSDVVVTDGWKNNGLRTSDPSFDDFRSKYEDLQSKFYGLAEQNEMLEQSLMEQNNLVKRWEAVLDSIDIPSQMRLMEPEDRIQWLGSALFESNLDRDSLREKIESFESYCGSLKADLEQSQRNVAITEAALGTLTHERDLLFQSVERLSIENLKVLEKADHNNLERETLWSDFSSLQEKLVDKEGEIRRVQLLVSDALHSHGNDDAINDGGDPESIEVLLRRLLDNYIVITSRAFLTSEKHVLEDSLQERDTENSDLISVEQRNEDALKSKEEELADVLCNLTLVKAERDNIVEKHNSLVVSYEELGRQKVDMQERISQEEQKLASMREKLNVAVRKGKALVQQRDSLKQAITVMNSEVEHLKAEINRQGNVIILHEQRIQDLSTYPEKAESLERESLFLKNRLAETEHSLQAATNSFEHELKKSKRAMELLLAELNEVQERGEGLQEELARVGLSLAELSEKHDASETEKIEALSRLDKIVSVCSEERSNLVSEITKLKADIDAFSDLIVNYFSADLELLRQVESQMEMLFKQSEGSTLFDIPLLVSSKSAQELMPYTGPLSRMKMRRDFDDNSIIELFGVVGYGLQECSKKMDALRDEVHGHCLSSNNQAKKLFDVMDTVRTQISLQTEALKNSGTVEDSQKELKATIFNLQKELQEKDIERSRINSELVNQIKEAEATTTKYSADLETVKTQVINLGSRLESLENERSVLELRNKELEDEKVSSKELHGRVLSLTGTLTSKDQEIEALMQALDEEESQIEGLTNRIQNLEKVLEQKNLMLESLEASRTKTMAKLSTTVYKFDELHQLSESLISEVENLQSQLQGRDAEISFLRQEVTRCTNDALSSSLEINKRIPEMHDIITWLDTMISRIGEHDVHMNDKELNTLQASKDILEKQVTFIISELEDAKALIQTKDALLQAERSRVEGLLQKGETLENSLRESKFQLSSLHSSRDPGEANDTSSEILEVEPLISKRLVSGTSISSHMRNIRKVNNDQVAINIDNDAVDDTIDDVDDDKVHGFKSLTTSRVVPRFTRPISDMVDGLWVSCDRALMRQPALRLGIILYWVLMHALLVTSIV